MIPFQHLLEVLLFSLLYFLPYLFLAALPFRKSLRFSKSVTLLLAVSVCLLHICFNFLAAFLPDKAGVLTLISTVSYILFYFITFKAHFGKLFASLLVLSNASNLATISARYLEYYIFGEASSDPTNLSFSFCLLLLHLLVTIPMLFYIKIIYTRVVSCQTTAWSFLWIIPAIFYLIWYYTLYHVDQFGLQTSPTLHNTVFLIICNIGSFVTYHIGVLLISEQEKARILTQQNHLLSMNQLQYDNLQSRIHEARQARHDLHHHIYLIRDYLHSGMQQELEAYLNHYIDSLPDSPSLVHCQHYATNVLLGYFAQQAQDNAITMDIFVQLPETLPLPDTTLSVILGNLLENAIEACQKVSEGEKKITVRGKAEANTVFFEITNTFNGHLRRNKLGKLLSTKTESHGFGLESVRQLAQANGGLLETDAEDCLFRASILLVGTSSHE